MTGNLIDEIFLIFIVIHPVIRAPSIVITDEIDSGRIEDEIFRVRIKAKLMNIPRERPASRQAWGRETFATSQVSNEYTSVTDMC